MLASPYAYTRVENRTFQEYIKHRESSPTNQNDKIHARPNKRNNVSARTVESDSIRIQIRPSLLKWYSQLPA